MPTINQLVRHGRRDVEGREKVIEKGPRCGVTDRREALSDRISSPLADLLLSDV